MAMDLGSNSDQLTEIEVVSENKTIEEMTIIESNQLCILHESFGFRFNMAWTKHSCRGKFEITYCTDKNFKRQKDRKEPVLRLDWYRQVSGPSSKCRNLSKTN